MRMSVALSLTASGDTLRMRVAISNSPSCTRRLKSCWRCCGCRWRASEQNSCKNAIRSPHSASPGVWRSRRRNSSGRKRGSDCSAVTTSTLLKSASELSVVYVASSSERGRITSLMYWIRYVWWILAMIAGSAMGTTSLNCTQLCRNSRCRCGALKSGSYSSAPTMSITCSSLSMSSSSVASLSMMVVLMMRYRCARLAPSSRSSHCRNMSSNAAM
mmetsp:Transcript_39929/g.118896  ORF Transcript_39929/g.118896 Transcript_39929/m.118896 type:complete len:216 (+) Transcript_39929:835-1482(+)